MAHEFCHILFDRRVGRPLTVVSGRWAPLGIEQRANAFAAMFLMPTESVREAVLGLNEPVASAGGVESLAARLNAGYSATLWHIRNLGVIDDFDLERIENERHAMP